MTSQLEKVVVSPDIGPLKKSAPNGGEFVFEKISGIFRYSFPGAHILLGPVGRFLQRAHVARVVIRLCGGITGPVMSLCVHCSRLRFGKPVYALARWGRMRRTD
jgi:hypothetical protein